MLKNIKSSILPINRQNWGELESIKIAEYDAVIHCAYDLKNQILVNPSKVLESNIISTAKLLEKCLEKKIGLFVFISSCAVYGESSNSSEEKPCMPITLNGQIKSFNEELIKTFCKSNNIKYLIFRPFNSYGGEDTFSVIQRIINCAKSGQPFTLINEGIAERDFIHVDDIAKIITKILEKNISNEIINIGSGESVRIIDIVDAIEKKIKKIEIVRKSNSDEAVYSRANLKKMNSIIDFEPRSIFDFINSL